MAAWTGNLHFLSLVCINTVKVKLLSDIQNILECLLGYLSVSKLMINPFDKNLMMIEANLIVNFRQTEWLVLSVDVCCDWCMWHIGLSVCKITRIPYSHYIRNEEVMAVFGCLSLFPTWQCSLRFLGPIPCSVPDEVHPCTVAAAVCKPSLQWKWPLGKTQPHILLRPIESDLSKYSRQDICIALYNVCDTHLYSTQVGIC